MLTCLYLNTLVAGEVISQSRDLHTTKISLRLHDAHLEDVFKAIESETGYSFAFDDVKNITDRTVSFEVNKESVYNLLLLLSKEADVKFMQVGEVINVAPLELKDRNANEPKVILQTRNITGNVTSFEDGEGLPGVNVVEKGTTNGTVTDVQGNYSLTVSENAVLVFSSVGYTTEELEVGNRSVIDLVMNQDIQQLQELVVIGYGTAKKEDLTGAISSISAEALEKQPSQNLTQILRGSIPGLDVGLSPSAKGTGNLLVRGKTSLKANNEPLVVVDGIIYYGDLADINPADVESIDVLKDASSAAVYGSRAASGVILITTKSGQGDPQVSFNVSTGFSTLKDRTPRQDAAAYLQMRSDNFTINRTERPEGYFANPNNLPAGVSTEQWRNYQSGIDGFSNEEIFFNRNELNATELENYLAGRETDWYDAIYRTGLRQDYNISINAATDNISYYYSLGYMDNEGFYTDERFKNIRTRLKLESDVADFLQVGINAQYSHRDESAQHPSFGLGVNMSPLGSIYHDDGRLRYLPHDDNAVQNPFYYRYSDNYQIDNDLIGNIYGKVALPLGFTYRINWINQFQWDNDYYFQFTTDEMTGSGADREESNRHQWFVDNILSWNRTFGDHRFDVTLLYNAEKISYKSTNAENSMFDPNEALSYHQLNHGTVPIVGANDWVSTASAMMARVNYSLMDRYLFTASIRRDGYSAFGVRNPYANFPSAAFAWRLSDENFFNVNWVDFLKLRVSYGVNGNRDVPTYAALQHLGSVKYIYNINGGKQSVTGFQPTRMANPELMWEETAAWNAGIDFAIFDGKLTGALEAYSMKTTNLLLDRSLPSITGYSNITSNLGAVGNKGLELSLTSINIDNPNFNWSSRGIFSMNRNEIQELYGDMEDVLDEDGNVIGERPANDYSNNWFIGEDIDRIWDYELDGVWQIGEEDEAEKYSAEPGDFKIVDQNADGVISPREDKVFLGYTTPRYKISLINDFTVWRNFDISFMLNMQLGWEGANNNHFNSGWQYARMGRYDYPYWMPDNPTNEWGSLNSNNPFNASYYLSRSFIRLQNFSVGYRVPQEFLQRFNVEALKISFDLQNPWWAGEWDLWDPETTQPTPMLGTFNVRLTL
ncbi:MAG: SusC/RagA family TonB-linked outer membrane protein [Candidatus Cyclobacteriaceae bacterium M3_2C_046]